MWVQQWLSSAVSTTSSDGESPPEPKRLISDTSSCSYAPSDTSSSSLQSSLSLITLPSVPSLQKFTLETFNLAVSYVCTSSSTPRKSIPISSLAVHGDLLYAASAHEINVYDRASFAHLDAINGSNSSSGSVKALTFCDGRIFTAHQDEKIRVWEINDRKKHKLVNTLPTINDKVLRFFLPKNHVTVRRHKRRLWIEHSDAVTGLAVNGGLLYSVSWDRSLKIWRASDLRCIESIKAHEDAINAVVVSGDGTVYTGSADRRIRVWGKQGGEKRHSLIATLEKHKSAVNALALNNDGSLLFSGACDRSILVWEKEDSANHMAVIGALRGHDKAILCLINVSDLLFSGSADRTVRIWQRGLDGNYNCLAVLDGHQKPVKSLVVSEGEGKSGVVSLVSGSLDGEIKAWQISLVNQTRPDQISEFDR